MPFSVTSTVYYMQKLCVCGGGGGGCLGSLKLRTYLIRLGQRLENEYIAISRIVF